MFENEFGDRLVHDARARIVFPWTDGIRLVIDDPDYKTVSVELDPEEARRLARYILRNLRTDPYEMEESEYEPGIYSVSGVEFDVTNLEDVDLDKIDRTIYAWTVWRDYIDNLRAKSK